MNRSLSALLIFAAAVLLILSVISGCGPDVPESASTDSAPEISAEQEFEGTIVRDENGVSSYVCPCYTISESGSWQIGGWLRTYPDEYYTAFTNTSTQQGNVTFCAYTGSKKISAEEKLRETLEYGEVQQYETAKFKGFDAYIVNFEKSGHREERIIFETDSALFETAAFFTREEQFYTNDKGSAESFMNTIEIIGGSSQ